jgi:DHA1 family bicyclomycin/chloramphenicol resistance-like MFS transporter
MVWARRLPETLAEDKRRPFTWSSVAAAGKEVVMHRQTMALTVAMTCLFGIMTVYLASSELILDDVYGFGAWFPLFFGGVAVLLAVNSLNNARIVQRLGVKRLLCSASILGVVAAGALAGISVAAHGKPNFWLFTLVLCIVIPTAQGLTPTCNTAAMTPLPHVAGTASAIIATITSAGGALLGGLASGAFNGTVGPFTTYVLVYMSVAGAFVWWGTNMATRLSRSGRPPADGRRRPAPGPRTTAHRSPSARAAHPRGSR